MSAERQEYALVSPVDDHSGIALSDIRHKRRRVISGGRPGAIDAHSK
jgi:hypothetical protein